MKMVRMKSFNRSFERKKTFVLLVNYLGGQLSFEKPINATGKELFMEVCTSLGITEYWYFGLQYETAKRHSTWVRPNTKVYSLMSKATTPLFFLVKYYPEDIGRVQEDTTLELIYKQCKISFVAGSIFIPRETSFLLASYILQAEQGEYPNIDYLNLVISDYLPPAVLEAQPTSHQIWINSLKTWHKRHQGLDTRDAHLEFVRVVQYFGMYGVSYFPAKYSGTQIWLGVHPKGIHVYEDNLATPKMTLKWIFIRLIHYSCRKFVVKTMLTQPMEHVFRMKSLHMTRQVFEFAVGYHNLFLRIRSVAAQDIRLPTAVRRTNDETFNEITEQTCKNDTLFKEPIRRKLSRRFSLKMDLPDVKEEEENPSTSVPLTV